MSSPTEMFPSVGGGVELPKTFINSLRILFDILDDDKDGFVPISVIELRWQGDGINGLPNGVLQSLRKIAPADGMLDFDLFCSALKLTLKTNKEQAQNRINRHPNKAAVKPNNFQLSHQTNKRPTYLNVNQTPNLTETENKATDDRAHIEEAIKPQVTRTVNAPVMSPDESVFHYSPKSSTESKTYRPVERIPSYRSTAERVLSPPRARNVASSSRNSSQVGNPSSSPPAYTFPHRRKNPENGPPRHASTRSYDQHDRYPHNYNNATRNDTVVVSSAPQSQPRSPRTQSGNKTVTRQMSASSKSRPSTSSSSSGIYSPTATEKQLKISMVKSPPPYMAHVKPQSQKVVKAQLVYPQSHSGETTLTPPRENQNAQKKTNRHRRREEPRRHTLSNGITTDFNALKRMKDLEQERDVLHQGLDLLDKCRDWYQEELVQIKEQQHQLITGKEMKGSNRQDRVTFRTSRIMEINRQMRALMNSTEAFPEHMNLVMPQRRTMPEQASPMVDELKDQNTKLTQEVSFKNDRIVSLEKEKASLIRQLFDLRGRTQSRERPEMSALF